MSITRPVDDWERGQEKIRLHLSAQRCYTWLGESLNKLKEKKFSTYHRELFPDAFDTLKSLTTHKHENGEPYMPRVNCIIFGNYGTGKTHLMAATINRLNNLLIPCRFMTGQGLFDALGKCMSNHQEYQHVIEEACKIPVLAIDDIDKTYISSRVYDTEDSFQVKTFFTIINRRYINELPTLITTNSMDITPYIGGAAFSRLKEGGCFIEMEGEDYRDSLMR